MLIVHDEDRPIWLKPVNISTTDVYTILFSGIYDFVTFLIAHALTGHHYTEILTSSPFSLDRTITKVT